ncbi:hypothetical protein NEHOM01_0471 [Nematocida homosporus]|uniref:uncharacterized protein n=1 Tax=Nematocida homosporus TaxID=1912981 RepID=UPI0022207288|nr:uncharacterized protein NEHOM01_0471 [Nematocida homosporus]KAI5184920.1 hypothetical protein NEHOM01_0471 [Nematocida homosporus]
MHDRLLSTLLTRIGDVLERKDGQSSTCIEERLASVGEDSIVAGIVNLFKKSEIDSAVEYFRRFRDPVALLEGGTFSSFLLPEEYWPKQVKVKDSLVRGLEYKQEYSLVGHLAKVLCIMFDRSETVLFTGGEDGLIKMVDVFSGRIIKSFRGHVSPIFDFVISYDNSILVSCDQQGNVLFWDILFSSDPLVKVALNEQIDYVEFIYATNEPVPLEQKRMKGKVGKMDKYRVLVVTNSGRVLRISLGSDRKYQIETLLSEIEEGSFNGACSSKGKRVTALVGLWPFAFLFDPEDVDGRFYMLETDDLLTSAVDISYSSLKIAASTYSPHLFYWRYQPNAKSGKSNLPTRKTFKGRDLEGAWIKETLKIEGMSPSIFITDMTFLANDSIIASVDNESNIRIIDIRDTSKVIMIEKDFKICSLTPHPIHSLFLSLEINGVVKLISEQGEIIQRIVTGISVAGGLLLNSTGTAFFLTDLDGAVYKYSLWPEVLSVPKSEFFWEDFVFLRDREPLEGQERLQQDTAARLEGILAVCQKNTKVPHRPGLSYTLQGEFLTPSSLSVDLSRYVQTIDPGTRSYEAAAILQLQTNMITNKVFETDYKVMQPPTQSITIPETDDESNTTIDISDSTANSDDTPESVIYSTDDSLSDENEAVSSADSDSNSISAVSNPSLGSSDHSSGTNLSEHSLDEDEEDNTASTSSGSNQSFYSDSDIEESYDSKECYDSAEENDESYDSNTSPANSSSRYRTRARRPRHPQRKAQKVAIHPEINFSEWILMNTPKFPLLPQPQDRLILIPSRLPPLKGLPKTPLAFTEPITVQTVVVDFTELIITAKLENHQRHVITIHYTPTHTSNDPFIIQQYYLDVQKKRFAKGQTLYFFHQGLLSKGTFSAYAKPHPTQPRSLIVSTGNTNQTIYPFDLQYSYTDYTFNSTAHLKAIKTFRTDEYDLFFTTVSKKQYPDYYNIISYPLSLNLICKRLAHHYYRTPTALTTDIQAILTNCQLYNEESSTIVQLCQTLVTSILSQLPPT